MVKNIKPSVKEVENGQMSLMSEANTKISMSFMILKVVNASDNGYV